MKRFSIRSWSVGRSTFVASVALGLVLAGGTAWRVARATPGAGVIGTPIAGPVVLDEIDVNSQGPDYGVKIKTRGLSDAYVLHNRIAPGGHSGRHSHPGPAFVLITAGAATEYSAADPTHTPRVYPAGTGFVEDPDHPHIVRNEGAVDLELVAFFLLPMGEVRRTDEPQPPGYPF